MDVYTYVHPALVRYTKRIRTEVLFCPMAENGLIAVRSQPQRGGPDRNRPEPDISEMARNSNPARSPLQTETRKGKTDIRRKWK